ncbi:hypothetical protein R1flu_005634 [Riccia fluitans]|uniref:Uncharacterized protein n=1 Tax=Riccia fluitans TaxID=41844 RepID=A0ABD1YTZ4_9MARC
MMYCIFVSHLVDVIVYVGDDHYVRLELNEKKVDVAKSISPLGNNLNKKPVVINFIHNNPHFKRFEQEAIKDAIHTGVFGSLGNNMNKYIPHLSLAVPELPAEKDKEAEEAKSIRKGKKKAPLESKKKKGSSSALEKLLSPARCIAEYQAERDRVLDDIPLSSSTTKHKRSALGCNVFSRDRSQNTEPAEEPSADVLASPLQKKLLPSLLC